MQFRFIHHGIMQGLPITEIEMQIAKEIADLIDQSYKGIPIQQAGNMFSTTLTQYGIPYYKHSDLAVLYLIPLYERPSYEEGNQVHREDSATDRHQHPR